MGDVAKYRNGKAHENDISEQGKFIVVNSKFVSTNGEVRKFSNKQIEPLFKNEIAFVLSDVPNGRAIARTFLVDKNDKYTLNQRIAGITPIEGTCPYFLHILMNRNKYFLQFDDGAKQTNLSVDDVIEFAEYYPSSEEQQQVGVLFQQLDNLITLHQRQPFLHSTPEISLTVQLIHPFYTSSWEQRKLSEMCGTFEYGLNAAAKEFDGKNKYIRITDIDDASREFLLSDLSSPDICLDGMSKYLLSSGDIVFARTGASVGKTYIYRENDGIVYFAGFLIRAKVNQDNDAEFVFQSTLSPSYEKYIRITSQRSGQPGVNAQEYGEYDLFAPSKEEQQRIGHFLRGIDNLITLHQRKGKAAVTGCSNDANNSKGVYCKARDFGYKCYKKVKSQQIRCLIAVFIFFV